MGGTDDTTWHADAEAVGLSTSSSVTCPDVYDFLHGVIALTTATLGGAPVLCGGSSGYNLTTFDPELIAYTSRSKI